MKKRLARRLTIAGSILSIAVLSACSSADQSKSPSNSAGTDAQISKLTWAVASGPRSLDFNHAYDGKSWVVYSELAEPLVSVDPTGKLIPKLAVSWTQPSPDKIVFKLRQGVKFWDGKPLTADDVVWSLNRAADPAVASEFAEWAPVKSVVADDPSTVTVTLKQPDINYIYNLMFPMIYEKAQGVAAGKDFGSPKGLIMGTGPYKIDSFSTATGATMTRNENYWGTKPTAKTIDVKVIEDPETLRLAIESGDVDGTFDVPAGAGNAWDHFQDAQTKTGSSGTVKMLFLDTSKPPFNDVHARMAIADSFDRAGIIDVLGKTYGSPANSVSSPFGWANVASPSDVKDFFASLPQLPLDMDAAKKELSGSATPNGFNLTVLTPSNLPDLGTMLQTLKQNVKPLGINITIKQVPLSTWLDALRAPNKAPMGIVSISANAPHPLSLVQDLVSADGTGFSPYGPPAMLKLINEYRTASPERSLEIAKDVTRQLSVDMPFVPIVYGSSRYALNNKFVYAADITGWTSFGDSWAQYIKSAN